MNEFTFETALNDLYYAVDALDVDDDIKNDIVIEILAFEEKANDILGGTLDFLEA